MSEPNQRQVLYALVSAGFILIVVVLMVGSALSGLVPVWWTLTMALLVTATSLWSALNWRKTGPVLLLSIGLFVIWAVGTLAVA